MSKHDHSDNIQRGRQPLDENYKPLKDRKSDSEEKPPKQKSIQDD